MADHEDYLPGEAPMAHHDSHESLGSDEISVAGLHGQLADDQPCIAHDLGGAKHVADSLADLNTKVSDATLEDKTVLETTMDTKVATHAALPTVHQDAPALIATHAADASAHHAKYTDAEAVSAIYSAKPCFHAQLSARQHNKTGDGTLFNLTGSIWTEIKDQGSNFANGFFTAPSTGIYLISFSFDTRGLSASHTYGYYQLFTPNRAYTLFLGNLAAIQSGAKLRLSGSFLCDMDAGDSSYIRFAVSNGLKTVDLYTDTFFSGSRII